MPPITDPALLEQIKRQQQAAGTTLAGPARMAPYYPPQPSFTGGAPMSLPPRQQQLNSAENTRIGLAQSAAQREATIAVPHTDEAQSNAEIARLKLREERIKQGFDPDTGKQIPGSDKFGDDALADLTPGEKNQVKAITQGRFPVTSFSMRNPEVMKLIQKAFQYEPGTDLTTFQRRSVAFQKFMSNPNSPMLRVNQALQHLDRFAQNAQKLDNFHYSLISNPANLANYIRTAGHTIAKDPALEAFLTDRDALATELAAAFQGTGNSALADREEWQKRLSAANTPEGFDKVLREAVGLLGGRVEASNAQFKQAVGANADFYDLMSPAARKAYAKWAPPGTAAPLLTDESEGKADISTTHKTVPIPEGYQEAHNSFLAHHPPGTLTVEEYRNIRQQLDQQFLPPTQRSNLSAEEVQDFVDSYNKGGHVSKIPSLNIPLSDEREGLGAPIPFTTEKERAEIAASPAGTFASNLFNAGSFGAIDAALTPEQKRAKALVDEKNPKSAFAGEVIGSLAPTTALERAGLKLATKIGSKELEAATARVIARDAQAAALRRAGGDAAVNATYGAARGYNGADEGKGVEGAVEGALAGAVGSVASIGITKGVTPFLGDTTRRSLQALKGVKTTTLQKLGLGRVEQSMAGMPLSHGAQAKAVKSFNVDNANRALSYIGGKVPKGTQPGTELNAEVNRQLSGAYNEIRPQIVGSANGQFTSTLQALHLSNVNTPQKKAMFDEIKDAVDLFLDVNGHYTGQGYKAASERLRYLTKSWSTQAESHGEVAAGDMARTAEQTRKQMQLLIQRQTPEVGARLKNIERGWAHAMRIEDASNRALANNEAVYSPGQYLTSIKKLDTSAHKGASARGKAFDQQYGEAAANVLGSNAVPKISPKETSIVLGAVGGSAWVSPAIPGVIAGITTGLYGPGAKRAVQAILSGKRPRAVDNMIVRRIIADEIRHKVTEGK
jgi:hypothetical protein